VSLTFFGGSGLSGDGSEAADVLLPGDEGTAEADMFLKGSTSWLVVSTLVDAVLLADLLAEVGSFRLASRTRVSAIAAQQPAGVGEMGCRVVSGRCQSTTIRSKSRHATTVATLNAFNMCYGFTGVSKKSWLTLHHKADHPQLHCWSTGFLIMIARPHSTNDQRAGL